MARLYLRQTFALGDKTVARDSGQMQLGAQVARRRLVLIIGNFSLLDFFDRNSVQGDPRRGLLNMAFITNSSYDFGADARGYTWGGIAELYFDDWAGRFGRVATPYQPNQAALEFQLTEHYGDQVEVEHTHTVAGAPGTVRVLGFRNHEVMGRFADAIALYKSNPGRYNAASAATQCVGNPDFPGDPYHLNTTNLTAPDLCWARRANVKMGVGAAYEQHLTDDVGFFVRAMYADGKSEVYSYTSADRSVSVAMIGAGSAWHRPRDVAGVGYGAGWISSDHARYLGMGGIDGFVGDGRITPASEQVVEAMYSMNVTKPAWLSLDYQHVRNPAFNKARGPVDIAGARLHAEF